MEKYKVFGVDSNFGRFESVFDNKDIAYEFYMYRLEMLALLKSCL